MYFLKGFWKIWRLKQLGCWKIYDTTNNFWYKKALVWKSEIKKNMFSE